MEKLGLLSGGQVGNVLGSSVWGILVLVAAAAFTWLSCSGYVKGSVGDMSLMGVDVDARGYGMMK